MRFFFKEFVTLKITLRVETKTYIRRNTFFSAQIMQKILLASPLSVILEKSVPPNKKSAPELMYEFLDIIRD